MTLKADIKKDLTRIKGSVESMSEVLELAVLNLSEDDCADLIVEAEDVEQAAIRIARKAQDWERNLMAERQLAKRGGD